MAFKLIITPEAKVDIEDVIEYYSKQVSVSVAESFYTDLNSSFDLLEQYPHFQLRYKNVRGLPLKKFPFIVFYEIIEDKSLVKVLSVFNTNKDTKKYPNWE